MSTRSKRVQGLITQWRDLRPTQRAVVKAGLALAVTEKVHRKHDSLVS